jgi:hypothetical protein
MELMLTGGLGDGLPGGDLCQDLELELAGELATLF